MKHFLFYLFLATVITSCGDKDDVLAENITTEDPYISKIASNYFNSSSRINYTYVFSEGMYTFEYDHSKRLSKKIGGMLSMGVGFDSFFFSDEPYTLLTYTDSNVTVEYVSESSPEDIKYYTLNTENQILTKEIPGLKSVAGTKKLYYTYSNNKLSEILTTYPYRVVDPNNPKSYKSTAIEKFYYDSKGNLTKTVFYPLKNDEPVDGKIIRLFEDYDNSFNPTKRLQLIEEYFYSSLSTNNYRTYSVITTDSFDVDFSTVPLPIDTAPVGVPSLWSKSWNYNYDSKGQIIGYDILN